ncbi:hypothetical protein TBLA_0G00220 [Henningerozyma blattae CBS 6284]|uniref:Altered inheritance of mitochondria protein 6 n=1 Tax=Henningerozyma blattae (strain ATCC 34711 / CBS 6284 / DSM 70876 / NBRC 10599 / NRRL Y-10934 / UCD 77-7) TaxID=1071380 RepID=I2H6H0_HENB6|nr:hypothetical protein TBLA_0G00220 [Tetrapisispora blattae CBS 6284]CCH61972.1 hypothetical protein TBLA_0G00220 [Tetrapisispora blattae CBS 6284]
MIYLVLGMLILSQHDEIANSNNKIALPIVTIKKGPKAVASHISDLGLTGDDLIVFFKKNLRKIITYDSKYRDLSKIKNIKVSQYYDVFYRYLFLETPDSSPDSGLDSSMKIPTLHKLTRNVTPLPIHSHNDYWRDLPLFEALMYGSTSVEADIWNVPKNSNAKNINLMDFNGMDKKLLNKDINDYKLAVGHNINYLDTKNRLLDNLYTTPLKLMLDEVNINIKDSKKSHHLTRDIKNPNSIPHKDYDLVLENEPKIGVFYDSPHTTLYFYLDFKSDDNELTYKLLLKDYLKPLIDQNYLSYYDIVKNEIVSNPITVILTGNYPRKLLNIINSIEGINSNKLYTFMEAPLDDLKNLNEEQLKFSIVSSTSFSSLLEKCDSSPWQVVWRGEMTSHEINCIKNYMIQAQSKGFKTRIWGVPSWPKNVERTLWKQQIRDLNVDFLNVDDLASAVDF